MARRGPRAPNRSQPRGLQARLRRMARVIANYATPWRVLLALVLVAGLIGAVTFDQLLVRIGSAIVAGLAIFTLLAQLNHRLNRAVLSAPAVAASLPSALAEAGPKRATMWRAAPIVSVVIPGKNESLYAPDCIRSLKQQTLENFEAIIIDDASTDSTLGVLFDEIADDPRFRIVRTSRSVGIGLARNEGVRVSTAKYVTFLDLDDFLAPDALASRVELAERHADMPWVAGSYCWHQAVDAEATPESWLPRPVVGRDTTISWMGHYDDNFFIASAPLLRRDAFLAAGGFDDAPTAEDVVFWFKLLRWGFILVGTGAIGIGYRQKPASHAVATAVQMRDTIVSRLAERSEPMSPPVGQAGPYFFADDLGRYRTAVGFTRRTASALGIAVADGHAADVVQGLIDDLGTVPPPLVGWEVDVRGLANRAALRVTRPRREQGREAPIAREVERLTGPLLERARREAGSWLGVRELSGLPDGPVKARSVKKQRLLPVTPESLRSVVGAGRPFLLLPSSAYHTDELIDFVDEARRRGLSPVAMLNEKRWATTGTELSRVDVPAVAALPPGDWLDEFDGLLTFNDWGEYFGDYVKHVAGRRTVSFAKVEGVQDWHDRDTGRIRNPYLSADVVLCQGDNDVRALEGRRERLEVVGSARLEAIWTGPLPADAPPRVVGNVNFTYGVQDEHRDMWVETLREACERANVPLDLSLHPSESAKYPGLAAAAPIRHLMVQDSILVSRFSTVLFEGMARGCSVIYYNPHGEKVETFQHPEGAFDVARDPASLADLIQSSKVRKRAEAKERAAGFFTGQVSMVPGTSVAMRMADAIERNLVVRSAPDATVRAS